VESGRRDLSSSSFFLLIRGDDKVNALRHAVRGFGLGASPQIPLADTVAFDTGTSASFGPAHLVINGGAFFAAPSRLRLEGVNHFTAVAQLADEPFLFAERAGVNVLRSVVNDLLQAMNQVPVLRVSEICR